MAKELHNFDGNEVIATELPQYLNQNFTAIPSNMGVWEKNEAVEVGDIRLLSGRENAGYVLECVASGITGETQPVIIEEDANIVANYSDSGVVGRMRLIFNSSEKDVDEVFATGVVYSRLSYPELWNYAQSRGGLVISEEEWQAKFAETNGKFVPYYSSGDGGTTFRTPMLGAYIKGAENSDELGEYKQASLPHHTHNLNVSTDGEHNHLAYVDNNFCAVNTGDINVWKQYLVSVDGNRSVNNSNTNLNGTHTHTVSVASTNNIYPDYTVSTDLHPETMTGIWVIKAIGVVVDSGNTDLQGVLDGIEVTQNRITNVENNYLPLRGGLIEGWMGIKGTLDLITDSSIVAFNLGQPVVTSALEGGVADGGQLFLFNRDTQWLQGGGWILRAYDSSTGTFKDLACSTGYTLTWDGHPLTHVAEKYSNGTSWYRVWSDGWIEQGGQVLVTKNTETVVTLLKSMSNTNYCIQGANISYYNNSRYACSPCCKKTSATTITLGNIEDTDVTYSWMVCGY